MLKMQSLLEWMELALVGIAPGYTVLSNQRFLVYLHSVILLLLLGTWLHYRDEKGMGELKPENIKAVLDHRDMAARTPCGRAAAVLAKLDYQYYEKSIDESYDKLRIELLEALKKKDETKIDQILESYHGDSDSVPQQQHNKLNKLYDRSVSFHRAYNMLRTKKPIAARSFSVDAWEGILDMISASCEAQNKTAVENVLFHIDKQMSI